MRLKHEETNLEVTGDGGMEKMLVSAGRVVISGLIFVARECFHKVSG